MPGGLFDFDLRNQKDWELSAQNCWKLKMIRRPLPRVQRRTVKSKDIGNHCPSAWHTSVFCGNLSGCGPLCNGCMSAADKREDSGTSAMKAMPLCLLPLAQLSLLFHGLQYISQHALGRDLFVSTSRLGE